MRRKQPREFPPIGTEYEPHRAQAALLQLVREIHHANKGVRPEEAEASIARAVEEAHQSNDKGGPS